MRKGPKVARAVVLFQPGELESRPGIVGIHPHEQKAFVVAETDVVLRPEFLDQTALVEHGLGLAADNVPLEFPDALDQGRGSLDRPHVRDGMK